MSNFLERAVSWRRLATLFAVPLWGCASIVMPGDGAHDAGPTDQAHVDLGFDAADVPDEPIACDPAASRCHIDVNFCLPFTSVCRNIDQCEAADSGAAFGFCTHSGPMICAKADHCDDDSGIPAYASCHCGNGPPCPAGAVCISTAARATPHCECIVPDR